MGGSVKFESYLKQLEGMNASVLSPEKFVEVLKNIAAVHPFRDAPRLSNISLVLLPHVLKFHKHIILQHKPALLADLLWSYGRVEFTVAQFALCTQAFEAFLHLSHDMYTFSRGLYGGSRMGVDVQQLSSNRQEQLYQHVVNLSDSLDERGLANILYSLAIMNVSASSMNGEALEGLLEKAEELLYRMEAQGVANSIYAFGNVYFLLHNNLSTRLSSFLSHYLNAIN
jgi:hypothetical protein